MKPIGSDNDFICGTPFVHVVRDEIVYICLRGGLHDRHSVA